MNTLKTVFIILTLLLSQCGNKKEKMSFFENFKMKGITIVNKQEIQNIDSYIYRPEKNDTIISYYNKIQTSIVFLGIGKSNFTDTIHLHDIFSKYELENCIGHLYVNDNMVFILASKMHDDFSRLDFFVFQLDMLGNIFQSWDIAQMTGINESYFGLKKSSQNPIVYLNGKLIIMANVLHHPKEKKDVSNTPTELILDTEANKAYFVYAKPEIYGNAKYYGNHTDNHSKVFINDSVFVLSFPIDHSLYKYHINGKLIAKKICKSQYIDEFKDFEWSENMGFEKIIEIQTTQAYYSQVTYDSHNKLIFRLALHEQAALANSGEKASFFDRSFSIIVVDENLQFVGEYYIPPYHLYPGMIQTNFSGGPFFELANFNPSFLCIAEYEFLFSKQNKK